VLTPEEFHTSRLELQKGKELGVGREVTGEGREPGVFLLLLPGGGWCWVLHTEWARGSTTVDLSTLPCVQGSL
jgi:putative hemolysin